MAKVLVGGHALTLEELVLCVSGTAATLLEDVVAPKVRKSLRRLLDKVFDTCALGNLHTAM